MAAQLLVVAVDLTSRVARGWAPPSCLADELVLRCLLDQVAVLADTYEVALEPGWREMLEEALFEDLDHELLYDPAVDGFEDDLGFPGPPGMAPMGFEFWFVPFNAERRRACQMVCVRSSSSEMRDGCDTGTGAQRV